MKKYLAILIALTFIFAGCSKVTQSKNTNLEHTGSENSEIMTEENNKDIDIKKSSVSMAEGRKSTPNRGLLPVKGEEKSLEDIILKMKEVLDISDSYDEISTEEYEIYDNLKSYSISYFNTENENSASVSTDVYGNLISFNQYKQRTGEEEEKYTKEEAGDKIKLILKGLYGDASEEFKICDVPYMNNLNSDEFYFEVTRVYDDIVVPTDKISIYLNKSDLLITNINVMTDTNFDFSDTSYFQNKEEVKDIDEGFEKFKEINKLYRGVLGTGTDESSMFRSLKYIPAFAMTSVDNRQTPIDGITLEPVYNISSGINDYGSTADDTVAAKEESALTSTEQEHIDDLKNQKTVEEAEKKARSLFNLDKEYELNHTNFSNYRGTKGVYSWTLYFTKEDSEDILVSLLADDLSLLSYGKYIYSGNSSEVYNDDIEKYISNSNNFLVDKGNMNLDDLVLIESSKYPQSGTDHSIKYLRKINDDLVNCSDVINITISKNTGEVTGFYKYWDYKFDEKDLDVNFNIDIDEAYDILKDAYGFDLVYRRDRYSDNKPVKPVYELSSKNVRYLSDFVVNGETGEVIDSYGKPIDFQVSISYKDIEKAEHPEIIKKLADNNIGYYDSHLRPKENIRQVDMLRLILSVENYNRTLSDEEVYEYLGDRFDKVLKKDPESSVTNRDYAKIVSKFRRDYSDIAKENHIFKDRFDDIDSTDKDYGFLVIAEDKGYIKSENNKLYPDKNINRETALYYIYNLVNNK